MLALGFVVRATLGPGWSLLARLSAAIAARLWAPRPVAAAPKRFAQGIGAICLVMATGVWLGGYPGTAWAVTGLVGVFATLEVAAGFCVGCWIHGRLQARGVMGSAVCVDCVRRELSSASDGEH